MRIIILSAVALLSTFVLFSCKKDNPIPPEEQPQVTLSLEDVSCTEAWIKLSTNNVSLPTDVELYKDSSLTETISLSNTDSLLYVDSLLPNQTYSFHTIIHSYNHTITSDPLQVSTMDTTSHNFTWQTWTFGGQAGSCTLYDVAIIDENDIWAVGEIYLLDTTGVPDPNAYNAVHWDGSQWELIRIKTNACGGVDYPPIKTVFAFSSDDILFAHIDGSISHYNGIEFTNDCSLITQLNGSVNKMWGISKNDFYVVSDNGFIAHFQNGNWIKIESGTNININDIYGSTSLKNNTTKILAVAHLNGETKILSINNYEAKDTLNWPENQILQGIWINKNRIYVGGLGIWTNINGIWIKQTSGNKAYLKIRGSDFNNIFSVGNSNMIHFNGVAWNEINNFSSGIIFTNVDVKNNIVAVAGYTVSGGFIDQGAILLGIQIK